MAESSNSLVPVRHVQSKQQGFALLWMMLMNEMVVIVVNILSDPCVSQFLMVRRYDCHFIR